jgi:hypothetical protein
LESWIGSIRLGVFDKSHALPSTEKARWRLHRRSSARWEEQVREAAGWGTVIETPTVLGLGYQSRPTFYQLTVPHWFVALILIMLAIALKPKPRLRFNLSDLLVLMTLSAVLNAGVAGLTRLAS